MIPMDIKGIELSVQDAEYHLNRFSQSVEARFRDVEKIVKCAEKIVNQNDGSVSFDKYFRRYNQISERTRFVEKAIQVIGRQKIPPAWLEMHELLVEKLKESGCVVALALLPHSVEPKKASVANEQPLKSSQPEESLPSAASSSSKLGDIVPPPPSSFNLSGTKIGGLSLLSLLTIGCVIKREEITSAFKEILPGDLRTTTGEVCSAAMNSPWMSWQTAGGALAMLGVIRYRHQVMQVVTAPFRFCANLAGNWLMQRLE